MKFRGWKIRVAHQLCSPKYPTPWVAIGERLANGVRRYINAEGATKIAAIENLQRMIEGKPNKEHRIELMEMEEDLPIEY